MSTSADRRKLRVGVVFGSRSVEHEVSIVTALQVIGAIDRSKYDVLPIYITKDGQWLTGDALAKIESYKDLKLVAGATRAAMGPEPGERALVGRPGGLLGRQARFDVDVVFPCIHGTYGEDGTLQGLLELADIPYVGAGVVGSAVGMDKIVMKAAFRSAGIPTVRYVDFIRSRWRNARDAVITEVESALRYPLFVKPANLGSSIGISKAADRNGLVEALEVAAQYDRRLLVEESAEGAIEINCSVMGNDEPMASVCEQPVAWQSFLSYDDKYLRGGKGQSQGMKSAQRRIPAPISDELTRKVQETSVAAFRAVDCAGIARVDCLVREDTGEVLVNEINTIPGSMSFYLWDASGVPFAQLTDRLIQLALERHADRAQTVRSYDSAVIAKLTSGTKGRGAKTT